MHLLDLTILMCVKAGLRFHAAVHGASTPEVRGGGAYRRRAGDAVRVRRCLLPVEDQ